MASPGGVIKTPQINITISESAKLEDLIDTIRETLILQKNGYTLKNNLFRELYGKTLEFAGTREMSLTFERSLETTKDLLGHSIDALDLSPSIQKHLKNAGIERISQLIKKWKSDLTEIKGLGNVSAYRVQEALEKMGLSLLR